MPGTDDTVKPSIGGCFGIRARGSLKVTLILKRGSEVRTYKTGEPLYPGDHIRLILESPSSGYLTLLAKDEKNRVSVYYNAIPTKAGSTIVPDSLRLDDYLGRETWLILLANKRRKASEYIAQWRCGNPFQELVSCIEVIKEKRP